MATKIEDRRKEIKTALTEIVDTIERYFLIAPFEFVQGEGGELGYRTFPDEETWPESLFPEVIEADRKLKDDGVDSDGAWEMAWAREQFGFLRGVLVGMKAMGATRDQLLEKARGFAIPAIEQAEGAARHEERKAEEARKKLTAAERRRQMAVVDGGRKETKATNDPETLH